MHTKLKEGLYLVTGALRGALLDTNTGNVYSVNEVGLEVLKGDLDDADYVSQLLEMGLVEVSNTSAPLPSLPRMSKVTLQFVWFEILSDDCNESCVHCYAESMPPSHRANIGLPVINTNQRRKLSFEEWRGLIKQSFDLGCKRCQFIGGEPMLYKDDDKTVLDLAEYARQLGYQFVEIFTNGTLLNPAKIDRIKSLGLNMAVSLYSDQPDIHDAITQTPGSHALTVKNLKLLKAAGIKTRVETVVMRQNEKTVRSTQVLISEIGFSGRTPDPLRPKGRGDNPLVKPSGETVALYGVKLGPNFQASRQTIAHYSGGHSCLAGKITITDSGDVLPCIFSRNHVIGNVIEAGGVEAVVVAQAIQQIWNTTKDNVMVCQDCEYRYVCFDCRPLSEAAAHGNADYLHAPYPRCSYNPYTGEWAGGLWRVDDSGTPYYDRTVEPVLRQVVQLQPADISEGAGH